jgi:hypothetical protein
VKIRSRFDNRRTVDVDARARNPLADDYRQINATTFAAASRKGPPPTLFNSGDLPPYTASGNPPSALLQLPWQLRHAAARADQAEWARLFNEYGPGTGDDAAVAMMFEPAVSDPANGDYERRMHDWLLS